jgi:non-specific serine/threonine protein kinase
VLDGCERVVGAGAEVGEAVLGAFPDARLLATRRESLGGDGELVVRVPPLAPPAEGAASVAEVDARRDRRHRGRTT